MKRYFGSLSFYRQALMIGVPVMLQSLIQSLVSLVDNFMVAGLGDVKMSGVSVAGQILFVFMVLSNAICAAGGIYMTQFSGAKNSAGIKRRSAKEQSPCWNPPRSHGGSEPAISPIRKET